MPLPDITHLQFAVLTHIVARERSGEELREKLAEDGFLKSLPAFYQLMARLEEAGLVKGRLEKVEEGAQVYQERRYRATGSGVKSWEATRDFYMHQAAQRSRSAANAR